MTNSAGFTPPDGSCDMAVACYGHTERLEHLASSRQILVVTHSPQVAARAQHHWCVRKVPEAGRVATRVGQVADAERREEIARMLSGAEVTEEARAAADRLMGAA